MSARRNRSWPVVFAAYTLFCPIPARVDEYFLFTDGSGMIVLEIWNIPASLVPLNEPITVFGEVEINRLWGKVYIDVKGIQPVD